MLKRILLYRLGLLLIGFCCLSVKGQQALNDTIIAPFMPSLELSTEAPPQIPRPPATPTRPFEIGNIHIEGNSRTKPYIIARELPFREGDSVNLADLVSGFEVARQQLMNTRLFNEVIVALKSFRGHVVDVLIQVKERWYIFPIPYVKPIDRNLSEWAKQGYGTDRLNYGFKFTYYNFTGRNDKLRLWLVTGYTKQIQFQYDQPFVDKSLKHGYKIGFSYSSNNEVNVNTDNNQQVFVDTMGGMKKWTGSLEYTYRPALRTIHALRFGFTQMSVGKQILELNPHYLPAGRSTVSYPELAYTLSHYHVDYIPFPLKGFMGEASLLKRGINKETDMWQLAAKFTRAWEIGRKLYFVWQGNGVIRYPFDQPFVNSQLFGYNEMYLRGMERYVIDGVAGILFKQTFRRELFHFNVPTFIRSKSHDKIPFRFYAKTFMDAGYAHNEVFKGNSLVNQMMYTAGFGLDITTFYDFVFRIDYSFNQLGQKGLFLHLKNEF